MGKRRYEQIGKGNGVEAGGLPMGLSLDMTTLEVGEWEWAEYKGLEEHLGSLTRLEVLYLHLEFGSPYATGGSELAQALCSLSNLQKLVLYDILASIPAPLVPILELEDEEGEATLPWASLSRLQKLKSLYSVHWPLTRGAGPALEPPNPGP